MWWRWRRRDLAVLKVPICISQRTSCFRHIRTTRLFSLSALPRYEGMSKSFEPHHQKSRFSDSNYFIFQRSPLPHLHTSPIWLANHWCLIWRTPHLGPLKNPPQQRWAHHHPEIYGPGCVFLVVERGESHWELGLVNREGVEEVRNRTASIATRLVWIGALSWWSRIPRRIFPRRLSLMDWRTCFSRLA